MTTRGTHTHRETPGRAMSQEPKQLFLFLCDAHRSYEGSTQIGSKTWVSLDPSHSCEASQSGKASDGPLLLLGRLCPQELVSNRPSYSPKLQVDCERLGKWAEGRNFKRKHGYHNSDYLKWMEWVRGDMEWVRMEF